MEVVSSNKLSVTTYYIHCLFLVQLQNSLLATISDFHWYNQFNNGIIVYQMSSSNKV